MKLQEFQNRSYIYIPSAVFRDLPLEAEQEVYFRIDGKRLFIETEDDEGRRSYTIQSDRTLSLPKRKLELLEIDSGDELDLNVEMVDGQIKHYLVKDD